MDDIIGVTGYRGRLGSMLMNDNELNFVPLDCNVTDIASIENAMDLVQPTIVINCAAYTDVDLAEHEYTKAIGINAEGVKNLREEFDGWLIHMSTDYIFGGEQGPYSEKFDVNRDFAKGKYGRSKAYGEHYVFEVPDKLGTVVRTTMLYGNPEFPDFVSAVVEQLKAGVPFEIPYTLQGSPTYIPHLIEGIKTLITHHWHNPPPIVNIVGSDVISRYDFALMIASVFGYDKTLIVPTRKGKGEAQRPHKAGLKIALARGMHIPIHSVIEGLEEYKNEYEKR